MRRTTQTVVFDASDPQSVEALALAEFGQSYEAIAKATGLTHGKIAYRLKKARLLEGVPKGQGYSLQYRRGETFAARLVLRHLLPRVEERVRRTLPRKIGHPVPEVAKAA